MEVTPSHSLSKKQYIIKQLLRNLGFFFILVIVTQIIMITYCLNFPDPVLACIGCYEELLKQHYLLLKTLLMSLFIGGLVFIPSSLIFYWLSIKFFNRKAKSKINKPLRMYNKIYFYYSIRI